MAAEPTQEFAENIETSENNEEDSKDNLEWGIAVSTHPSYPNVKFTENEIIFGRGPTCQVIHQEQTISTIHCIITRSGNTVTLLDKSTNGTYMSEGKIGKGNSRTLSSGTEVILIPQSSNREKVSYIIYIHDSKRSENAEDISSKYDIRDVLGTGAFATVKLGIKRRTGERYAIKIIDKKKYALKHEKNRSDALMDEVRILQQLDHEHIIKIFDVYDTDKSLYLVLELVTGGDLFDQIVSENKGYPEARARHLFQQMVEAIRYLHSERIVHRDLKPENILLNKRGEDTIKISDFGLSRIVGENSFMKTLCGTPQYLAPEVLVESKADAQGYTHAVDVWSLGVILYILLSGTPPFDDRGKVPILEQVRKGMYSFPPKYWENVSASAKDIVVRMLSVDPKARISVEDIIQHPWMKGLNEMPAAAGASAVATANKKRKLNVENGESEDSSQDSKKTKQNNNNTNK